MNPMVIPQCATTPECHDSRTAFYSGGWNTDNSAARLEWLHVVAIGWRPFPGGEQLCKAHARLRYRIALG